MPYAGGAELERDWTIVAGATLTGKYNGVSSIGVD